MILMYMTRSVKYATDCTVFLETYVTLNKLSAKYFANYQIKKQPRVLEYILLFYLMFHSTDSLEAYGLYITNKGKFY